MADATLPEIGKPLFRTAGAAAITTSDDGQRSTFTFMTDSLARDGMVIDPDGVDVTGFLMNPVVLWQHGQDPQRGALPIGRAENVRRDGNGWKADVVWEGDEFAQRVASMVKRGTLSASSYGWNTLERTWTTIEGREVPLLSRTEMTEFSVVGVPSDVYAAVTKRSRDAGGTDAGGTSAADSVADAIPGFAEMRAHVERLSETVRALSERLSAAETVAEPTPTPTPTPEPVAAPVRAATAEDYQAALAAMLPTIRAQVLRQQGRA